MTITPLLVTHPPLMLPPGASSVRRQPPRVFSVHFWPPQTPFLTAPLTAAMCTSYRTSGNVSRFKPYPPCRGPSYGDLSPEPPVPPVPPDPPPGETMVYPNRSIPTNIDTVSRLHPSPHLYTFSSAPVTPLWFSFSNLRPSNNVASNSEFKPSRPPASLTRNGNSGLGDAGSSSCSTDLRQRRHISGITGGAPLPQARDKESNPNGYMYWAFMSLGLSQATPRLSYVDSSSSVPQSYPSTLLANPITDLLVSGFGELSRTTTPMLWKSFTAVSNAGVFEDSASMALRVRLFDQLSPMVTILGQGSASHMESMIEGSRNLQIFSVMLRLCLCFRLVVSFHFVISTSLAKSLDFICAMVPRD